MPGVPVVPILVHKLQKQIFGHSILAHLSGLKTAHGERVVSKLFLLTSMKFGKYVLGSEWVCLQNGDPKDLPNCFVLVSETED